MTCPYLEYRDEADGQQFATDRAYCTAADRFVQPMRADICNDRYALEHDRHCEIYLEHADGESKPTATDGGTERADANNDADANPDAGEAARPNGGDR